LISLLDDIAACGKFFLLENITHLLLFVGIDFSQYLHF
jgi:hypothetical protein